MLRILVLKVLIISSKSDFLIRLEIDANYQSLRSKISFTHLNRGIQKGRAFVLERNQEIVATILFSKENYFTNKNTAYVGQFAVAPEYKKNGFGSILMDYCEALALAENFEGIQLDTAKPATHLVNWYLKRGYVVVGETHWEGKTYDSYVFEKALS